MKEPMQLEQFVIYERPRDYPDKFVVRRFRIVPGKIIPDDNVAVFNTLDEAREFIPYHLINIGRQEKDEPQIVEVWA